MAKILFTAIVADMRNKLNGSVFSKNRYGAYVRTKVTPVNPQSTAQQNARGILSANSQAWRGLTEAERQAWIAATADYPFTDIFGNSKTLSGNALYAKLNGNLVSAGESPISVPAAPVTMPNLTLGALTAAETGGTVSLVFAESPVPAGFAIAIQTTPNVTPGKSFVKNLFRQTAYIPAAGTTPAVLTTAYAALHGAPVAGNKIFVRAFLVSLTTGQAGIPVQAVAIVGA